MTRTQTTALLVLMMTGVLRYVISPITNWVILTLFRMAQ